MAQRGFGLGPAPGFEAAVGVHPQVLHGHDLGGFFQQRGHLLHAGHAGRVDVVHARADLVEVAEITEPLQQLHVRAARLNRDHIRVHGRDGGQDVVELAVAHVGVDLRVVAHATGTDAEGARGALQITLPPRAAQRQPFADGGLVDLDDGDACGFEVAHLVADRPGDLVGGGGAGLVVAHKAPLQDGDGAGEHALHGLGRQALGVLGPGHRHGRGAGHVAVDDGRLHATRAIALHPAVGGEGKAVELLAKVFDHVVALGFAVHQYVNAQGFLLAHGQFDFGLHLLLVVRGIECATLEGCACGADLRRLRERANGGGGQQR